MKDTIKTEAVRRVARRVVFNQLDLPEWAKNELTNEFIKMCETEERIMEETR